MDLFPGSQFSIANSAATIAIEDFQFDVNRPGIALYGGEAVNKTSNPMQPVVTLEGRIIQIRSARAGETVGYGAAHRVSGDSKIAIVAVGYADGYPRSASGSGVPLRQCSGLEDGAYGSLGGYRVPLVGRVSMDLTAFDVTGVSEQVLAEAEWIEMFGKNVPIDDIARACGTIGYELLTGLGPRYSRSYLSTEQLEG